MKRNIHFKKDIDINKQKALDVVLKFDEYSKFIPGCSAASLLKRDYPLGNRTT